jgi:hypothetical protein
MRMDNALFLVVGGIVAAFALIPDQRPQTAPAPPPAQIAEPAAEPTAVAETMPEPERERYVAQPAYRPGATDTSNTPTYDSVESAPVDMEIGPVERIGSTSPFASVDERRYAVDSEESAYQAKHQGG